MTPEEERWTRIQNALETVAEGQAQHTIEIAELRQLHKLHKEEIAEETADLRRMHTAHMVAISKILETQRDMQRDIAGIAEMQRNTQKQIDQLTENIDRFLKGQGSNGKRDR